MDYSLLFAIEELKQPINPISSRNSFYSGELNPLFLGSRSISTPAHLRYHFAIIDYLQEFNHEKKFEFVMKSLICKYNNISSINPKRY